MQNFDSSVFVWKKSTSPGLSSNTTSFACRLGSYKWRALSKPSFNIRKDAFNTVVSVKTLWIWYCTHTCMGQQHKFCSTMLWIWPVCNKHTLLLVGTSNTFKWLAPREIVSFVSPQSSMFSLALPGETLRASRKQNSLFPLGLVNVTGLKKYTQNS